MAETEPTKICPLCAETINSAAKLCPFCRSRQYRHVSSLQEWFIAVPTIATVILAIVVLSRFAPEEKGSGGRSFSRHRNDLLVLHTSLDRDHIRPDYWLTGVVTNQGAHPWRVDTMEIRFLDKQGDLLDVRHPDLKDPWVVQSHQDHGFRVELSGLAFTNQDIIHQVRVQMATDGDAPSKSN